MTEPDDAPQEDFAQIVRRVAPRAAATPEAPNSLWDTARSVLDRAVAALSFDSAATTPEAQGMRNTATDTRHLLFSAKGRDIDLRVMPAAGGYMLSGQVFGPDDQGSVRLATHHRGCVPSASWQAATLDDLGEFHIYALVSGTYVLTLMVGDDEIALPPIDIGDVRT